MSPDELGIKYVGFDIPDKWVVGYGNTRASSQKVRRSISLLSSHCTGMDYDERYRCLPFIGVLKRSVYDPTCQA